MIELPVALRVPVELELFVVVDDPDPDEEVDFDPLPDVEGGDPEAADVVDEDFVDDDEAPFSAKGTDWVWKERIATRPATVAPMTSGARLISPPRSRRQPLRGGSA